MISFRPTAALLGASFLAVIILGAALVAGRPVAVVLATPFVGYAVLSRLRRPQGAPEPKVGVVDIGLTADPSALARSGAPITTIAWPQQPGLRLVQPSVITTDASTEPVEAQYASSRYGVTELGRLTWSAADPLAAWRATEQITGLSLTTRPPSPGNLSSGPLVAPIGTIGPHRSAQHGPGTTLADVRLHQSGDERRRINWRVTARARALHTNTTDRERDTDVVLIADTRHNLSAGRSSLDLTADALAALTQQYAAQGDRVTVFDPSGRVRAIPAGTGRRQAVRVVESLAFMQRSTRRPSHLRRPWPRVRANAVVLVCSPLLSDEVLEGIGLFVARGCQCLVVDTFPGDGGEGLDTALLGVEERRLALRMREMLRAPTLRRLRSAGVPVIPWSGSSSLRAISEALAQRPAVRRRP